MSAIYIVCALLWVLIAVRVYRGYQPSKKDSIIWCLTISGLFVLCAFLAAGS